MINPFDPFEFQLNLGGSSCQRKNSNKMISVLISPSTNVEEVAKSICVDNNIGLSLFEVIAEAIYGEIEKQIVEKQKRRSISRKDSKSPSGKNSNNNNKTKKFKNRFCSYLKESPAKPIHTKTIPNTIKVTPNSIKTIAQQQNFLTSNSSDVETFRNSEYFIDPSTINSSDEEYSFRPCCLETTHFTGDLLQNSLQITDSFISKCSYSTNNTAKNFKKSISQGKILKQKNQRTVFDNLYEHSILLNMKKEMDRKKSFDKLTFKPELNPTSKKIIQKKMQNPEQSSQKAIYLRKKPELQLSQSKFQLNRSPLNQKENRTPQKSVQASKKTQKSMSIYERGLLFRKKSQDKLSRMKEKQFYDEIKSCSFQPTFFSRKSVHGSRIA